MNRHDLPAPRLPAGRPNLVVTGFMGTGKTTSGREAAGLLGLPFVDLDEIIVRRAGRSIPEIFESDGEPAFRAMERAAVADAARLSGCVIATGGGAVLDAESFGRLAESGAVAVLTGEPDELARRLSGGAGRPLLDAEEPARVSELLTERSTAYGRAGIQLDTTGRSAADVAAQLVALYNAHRDGRAGVRIAVSGPDGPYPVVVGEGVLGSAGQEVHAVLPSAHLAVVVADGSVDASLGTSVAASLSSAGLRVERVALPPGESAKTLDVVAGVWRRLVELGVDRTSVVVAVGGGAALDAAGFAAATFARGVNLVNVPTTLLAMADASVGGKTAIDHGGAKNSVGAFHHPRLVLASSAALTTLPTRDLRAGFAEVVKMAATASPLVLDILERVPADGAVWTADDLAGIVEQAVRMKAGYVAEDAEDAGLRHTLNFGHTIAHGVEAASGYEVSHGEAVAIGVVAEARFGESMNVTPEGTAARIEALLTRLGLPTVPPGALDRNTILAAMGSDKKRRAGRTVVVVPTPGGATLLEDVDPAELLTFLPTEVRA
jgi:shikimate kinase / 3-dehydroquinate synthase